MTPAAATYLERPARASLARTASTAEDLEELARGLDGDPAFELEEVTVARNQRGPMLGRQRNEVVVGGVGGTQTMLRIGILHAACA